VWFITFDFVCFAITRRFHLRETWPRKYFSIFLTKIKSSRYHVIASTIVRFYNLYHSVVFNFFALGWRTSTSTTGNQVEDGTGNQVEDGTGNQVEDGTGNQVEDGTGNHIRRKLNRVILYNPNKTISQQTIQPMMILPNNEKNITIQDIIMLNFWFTFWINFYIISNIYEHQ